LTDYSILNDPSKRKTAAEMTAFRAIDILYQCPKCASERVFTWFFPSVSVDLVDGCCNQPVSFIAARSEEE